MDDETIRHRKRLVERTNPLLRLAPEERALLEGTDVVTGEAPEDRTTLGSLIHDWSGHVEWLIAELGIDTSDPRDRWTPYDLLAALYIRSRIDRALGTLPAATGALAERALSTADARFREFTEPDARDLWRHWLLDDGPGTGWWWGRIPREGPVRSDMEELYERLRRQSPDQP
jgi:hypothetical protein